ncbi:MAG: nitroreductase family protein [Eubacteriales bacterium]|nr:nitroreductase family protein [Eubacteriales bacterium]
MKHTAFTRTVALALTTACLSVATAAAGAEETVDAILAAGTTQAFTTDSVADADLERILSAGLSAASAMNTQPWFFAVVSNQDVMTEIAGSMSFGAGAPADAPEGAPAADEGAAPAAPPAAASGSAKAALGDSPVAIILYQDGSGAMGDPAFDCGLACQSMVIAASALGYGTKIVSSPTMALNGENHDALCEKLGVDPALQAVAVLLIGRADETVDGVTGATTRSAMAEKVSFVK